MTMAIVTWKWNRLLLKKVLKFSPKRINFELFSVPLYEITVTTVQNNIRKQSMEI